MVKDKEPAEAQAVGEGQAVREAAVEWAASVWERGATAFAQAVGISSRISVAYHATRSNARSAGRQ